MQTALVIVSQKGIEALTAKELGDALGSSSHPIFTVSSSMKGVQDEVRTAAMRRFESFANQKLPDMPQFKQVGMQMVPFGVKEPKLYQLLFMREKRNAVSFSDVFGELGPTAETCIGLIRAGYGMSEQETKPLFENVLDLHLWGRRSVRDAGLSLFRRNARPDAVNGISGYDAVCEIKERSRAMSAGRG